MIWWCLISRFYVATGKDGSIRLLLRISNKREAKSHPPNNIGCSLFSQSDFDCGHFSLIHVYRTTRRMAKLTVSTKTLTSPPVVVSATCHFVSLFILVDGLFVVHRGSGEALTQIDDCTVSIHPFCSRHHFIT